MASGPEITAKDVKKAIGKYRFSVFRLGKMVEGLERISASPAYGYLPEALYQTESCHDRIKKREKRTGDLVYRFEGPEREKFMKTFEGLFRTEHKYQRKMKKIRERQEAHARLDIAVRIMLPVGGMFIDDDDILEPRLPKKDIELAKRTKTEQLIRWNKEIFSYLKTYASCLLDEESIDYDRDPRFYFMSMVLVDALNFGYSDDEIEGLKKVLLPDGRKVLRVGVKIQKAVEKTKRPDTKMERIVNYCHKTNFY